MRVRSFLRTTVAAFVLLCVGSFATVCAQAPSVWGEVSESTLNGRGERRIMPAAYRTVSVDVAALGTYLASVPEMEVRTSMHTLALPTADGGLERFRIAYAPIMAPELAAVFPMIRTYAGESIDRPGVLVRFDLTPRGFHAMVLDPFESDLFIDPYAIGVADACIVYRKADFTKVLPEGRSYCSYEQVNDLEAAAALTRTWMEARGTERAGDCQRRTYRLALACTGEYANYHGSTTANNNKSFAMAAMVTTMNRVNGIYERDATITMTLVANTQNLIFLNAGGNPYTNDDGEAMLDENQATCTSLIGAANYDIGHVFSTGGGGIAALNSPCTSSSKAMGVTGSPEPEGDPFDIDYVAHEMGHQFGGNHTQNNACQRASSAAFEPGSASTIMGYAGICAPNVQNNSDALFLGYSLQEIAANITVGNSSGCPQVTASGNTSPTVNAGVDRTIPRSTPFVLTAVASDASPGAVLTYAWEQMNNQVSTQPPVATSTGGPNFRALLPSTSPSRYLPNLTAVIANSTPTWEVLPSVGRTLNFRVTVRDNVAGTGCTGEDNMTVTINAASGPFLVTQPNTALSWAAGSTQTVTWNVANTTASPVSCANVDILLSVNGGQTYPHTLLTATPNDGTQVVTLPLIAATTAARIMVRANGNIFYDISNANFTITAAAQPLLNAKIFLEGPYVSGEGRMHDSLRVDGTIPLTEPYTGLGFAQVGGGGETMIASVLNVTGDNAIVDWVRLELRSSTDNTSVLATRQALLQRDGDIVHTDGSSAVAFNVVAGPYFVVVRHRNHLGAMTASTVALSGSAATVDFRTAATATFGTDARRTIGGNQVLWAGNVFHDDRVLYIGEDNDRDEILQAIGGVVPTAVVTGYRVEDVNMDGKVKYTGDANDRDPILFNIGGVIPTAVRQEQLP